MRAGSRQRYDGGSVEREEKIKRESTSEAKTRDDRESGERRSYNNESVSPGKSRPTSLVKLILLGNNGLATWLNFKFTPCPQPSWSLAA